jgi:hypothetical protein
MLGDAIKETQGEKERERKRYVKVKWRIEEEGELVGEEKG